MAGPQPDADSESVGLSEARPPSSARRRSHQPGPGRVRAGPSASGPGNEDGGEARPGGGRETRGARTCAVRGALTLRSASVPEADACAAELKEAGKEEDASGWARDGAAFEGGLKVK
jgi:hypothetical protein